MNNWKDLSGTMVLESTSADRTALLNELNSKSIQMKNITYLTDLTMRFEIYQSDYKELKNIAHKQGASVRIIHTKGMYQTLKAIMNRPVLVVLFTFLLFLTFFLPSRLLFISVEGNSQIPTRRILEAAGECGIRFGVSRRQIRSEVMKNALLEKIPQLQWAGINTSGCTAVISVREKTVQETVSDPENSVCSIVAMRDGVIQNCTVYVGNPLCSVGQAVKAGQTLVSGYLDCGIVTKAMHASAEIRALTFRELELVTPAADAVRGELCSKRINYSLRIGKKLIKFYKDSGNLDTTCVKIYTDRYICLPGGFQLPISIIKETVFFYEDGEQIPTAADSKAWLEGSAQKYLESTMIAGEVISADTEINISDNACYLYGKYACIEMIGQVRYEQMMLKDGEND